MIQRKQSIYWLLLVIIIAILFAVPVYTISSLSDQVASGGYFQIHQSTLPQAPGSDAYISVIDYPGTIISIGILILTIFTIFRFKNRKQQMLLGNLNYLLILLLFANTTYRILSYVTAIEPSRLSLTVTIEAVLLILNFLAIRGVKKDDDLVRSADRIR